MGSSVKDKDNTVSYNVWSGGDYLNNTNGISILSQVYSELIVTSDESIKGNKSFKLIKTTNTNQYPQAILEIPISADMYGKTISVKSNCKIISSSNGILQLFSEERIANTNIPAGEDWAEYSCVASIPEDISKLTVKFVLSNDSVRNDYFLFDNIRIIIQ